MRRFSSVLLWAALLAGCRIEQTPPHLIDSQVPDPDAVQLSEALLRGRLDSIAAALQRRSTAGVEAALTAHPEVYVLGPAEGQHLQTSSDIAAALDRLAGGLPLTVTHLAITVGPRDDVAWFLTDYTARPGAQSPVTFRFSGVFLREGDEWLFARGHISLPVTPSLPLRPAPAEADTRPEVG